MIDDLPNVKPGSLDRPDLAKLGLTAGAAHPPRILLLYGSLRTPRSYSKLLALEAERLLTWMGCETRVYDPLGLPQV